LGPTATGKSGLAVKLALRLNSGQAKKLGINGAEIISADSRQVYKGLDIGTGKVTKKEMGGIPHHLLDVISPQKTFSVAEWKEQAEKKIDEIVSKGKLPIICGGTGFYIQSIVESVVLPEVPPNKTLRKQLTKKKLEDLQKILAKLDPRRFANIDIKNRVRLIRAIEIATHLGSVPPLSKGIFDTRHKFLEIGLTLPDDELKKKIHNRLIVRIKTGMITEAKKLHKKGLSWKRMYELGLEYRYLALLLNPKSDFKYSKGQTFGIPEFIQKLETEIWHYTKRQKTWFKRDQKIKWYKPTDTKKIEKVVANFLK